MTRRVPINRDLFGAPVAPPRDETPVRLPMVVLSASDDAWLLAPDRKGGRSAWAPKRLAQRGEGLEAGIFTMPRWAARDRGWL